MVFRAFVPIKKGRVMCWAYSFRQYSCNPKYITEYILDNGLTHFELVWAFNKGVDVSKLDKRIIVTYNQTFRFLYYMYSSEFIITNSRNDRFGDYFYKKKGQKYVMTWHGSTPIKMIEKDAEVELGPVYVRRAKMDSAICDLMLSNSKWYTNLIRSSFWYDGEILETGIPRNDIFFDEKKKAEIKERILRNYGISPDKKIVMYAPTFRSDNDPRHFSLNWDRIIPSLKKALDSDIVLFIRLHPNSIDHIDVDSIVDNESIYNMCFYHDMQELLCITDVLITDYSSTMFEIALLDKVCFLYADDINTYNRNFYFDLRNLPFPFAETEEMLIDNILSFNSELYHKAQRSYNEGVLCTKENGHATENVVNWMVINSMK